MSKFTKVFHELLSLHSRRFFWTLIGAWWASGQGFIDERWLFWSHQISPFCVSSAAGHHGNSISVSARLLAFTLVFNTASNLLSMQYARLMRSVDRNVVLIPRRGIESILMKEKDAVIPLKKQGFPTCATGSIFTILAMRLQDFLAFMRFFIHLLSRQKSS
jgi:hypothetical protein